MRSKKYGKKRRDVDSSDLQRVALRCGKRLGSTSVLLLLALADSGIRTTKFIFEARPTMQRALRDLEKDSPVANYIALLQDYKPQSVRAKISQLKKKGLIAKNGSSLTRKGKLLALLFKKELRDLSAQEQIWDGKYRIVAFDVPQKTDKERKWLRRMLIMEGYAQFQKSVYIGKRPISEELWGNICEKKIDHCVRLLTVGEIDEEVK